MSNEKTQAMKDAQEVEFERCYALVRDPKKKQAVAYRPGAEERIVQRLLNLGFEVLDYAINVESYRQFLTAARYTEEFSGYYPFNLPEKSLEHFIAAELLQLNPTDIYIDIASEHSPTPIIYHRLFGVEAYRQDLAYRPGLHGNTIGGDAAGMPIPDGFATRMALHCSFEHFEGDSDIGFIREAGRVLKPGGALCITPLYLFEEYAIQTDPVVSAPAGLIFEEDATVYCAQGWNNRHGRFYDPEHLVTRAANNLVNMKAHIYRITNAQQVHESCYARFAMLIKKLEAN